MSEALTVLLVEDNEQDAELVRLELQRGGFELTWRRVDTERDLRRELEDRSWDLIISDYVMPTFDGLRAFDICRELDFDTPFIFVSGALGEERAVAAMRRGARDYLLKDDLGRLNVAVRRELREADNRRNLTRAENLAERKQLLLQAALVATNAGLLEFSIPESNDSYLSERLAEILGYEVHEIQENTSVVDWLFEQVHPEDRPLIGERYRRFIDGELSSLQADARMRHRDGRWIYTSVYATCLERDEEGMARHVCGVVLDVSEARTLEQRYLQAQKMQAIGQLAGGIAHDFNNLLTVIISFTGFVRNDLPETDKGREDLGAVLDAADRAAALTRQLLLFSTEQPADLQHLDVCASVTGIENLLVRTIGEDIQLTTDLPQQAAVVLADSSQLDQIIMNLAVNARDAMPNGGALRISISRIEVDRERGMREDINPGPYVQISVSDTGTGMDDATLKRIFEPFFTTKGPNDGTGLGLATSYGIAKKFGGAIEVESKVGVGTTFAVILPHVHGLEARPTLKTTSTGLRGTETILVIEDEGPLRQIIERVLGGLGYRVLLAADGVSGLALFEANRETIDMVFSDIVLPSGSGFDLAETIRKMGSSIPILLTSGYTDRRVARAGSNFEIMWKPYTPRLLAKRIRACLDEVPLE